MSIAELPIGNELADHHNAELRRPHTGPGRTQASRSSQRLRQRWLRRPPETAHLDADDAAGDRHVDRQALPGHVPSTLHLLQHYLLDFRLLPMITRCQLEQYRMTMNHGASIIWFLDE